MCHIHDSRGYMFFHRQEICQSIPAVPREPWAVESALSEHLLRLESYAASMCLSLRPLTLQWRFLSADLRDHDRALVTLAADGAVYTAIVRGVNGTTEVCVVDMYALN